MFAYEGLGCIYWHMVSKLMLAAQEFALQADGDLRHRLAASYYRIQRGLDFRRSPQDYGAFPAEAYSHSPAQNDDRKLSFTLAGTPVSYRCRESLNDATLTVRFHDGQQRVFPGGVLPTGPAAGIIRRTDRIEAIDVEFPADWLLL